MTAVLLDRDGVINEERPGYVTRWEEFRFLPGALEAMAALQAADMRLAVITNQSAVGRGLLPAETLDDIHERMVTRCAAGGVAIERVFACRHAPWDGCACRKPRPGLLLQAMAALDERPQSCVAIGDSVEDLLAAQAASVPFVLVRTGRGEQAFRHPASRRHPPILVARDLRAAVHVLSARVRTRAAAQAA